MTKQKSYEIEAKFQISEPEQFEYLRTTECLGEAYTLTTTKEAITQDIYWDTLDARLLRLGFALRTRHVNDESLATLKSLARIGQTEIQKRLEIEEPFSDQQLSNAQTLKVKALPAPVQAYIAELVGKKGKLYPVCTLNQTRYKRLVQEQIAASELNDKSEQNAALVSPMAELSIDRVLVTPTTEEAATQSLIQFNEIEAELLEGFNESKLQPLVSYLRDEAGLKLNQSSKLERSLEAISQRLLDSDSAPDIQPAMHMGDACRLIWRQQLTQMLLNESGVRIDADIEYVHDMRVATRRARTADQLFGGYLAVEASQPFVREIKRTARVLGGVRDLDVALQKLSSYRKKCAKKEHRQLKSLVDYWKNERTERYATLMTWLDGKRYQRFVKEFAQFCQTPGVGLETFSSVLGETPPRTQLRHILPSMILDRFELVRSFEALFEREEPVPIETVHALRIECKYLRYTLEFAAHLLGPEGQILIKQLKRLQDTLGDLNDADVARETLTSLPKKLHNQALQKYIDLQTETIETMYADVPEALNTFVEYDNRERLMLAISHI